MKSRAIDHPYLVREYAPEDYPLCLKWWKAHDAKTTPPSETMLPRLGVMAIRQDRRKTPDACAFLYVTDNTAVSFIEFPVSRPGLGMERARAAFGAIVTVLKRTAASLGYHHVFAYTLPPIARELKRHGFLIRHGNLVQTVALTT